MSHSPASRPFYPIFIDRKPSWVSLGYPIDGEQAPRPIQEWSDEHGKVLKLCAIVYPESSRQATPEPDILQLIDSQARLCMRLWRPSRCGHSVMIKLYDPETQHQSTAGRMRIESKAISDSLDCDSDLILFMHDMWCAVSKRQWKVRVLFPEFACSFTRQSLAAYQQVFTRHYSTPSDSSILPKPSQGEPFPGPTLAQEMPSHQLPTASPTPAGVTRGDRQGVTQGEPSHQLAIVTGNMETNSGHGMLLSSSKPISSKSVAKSLSKFESRQGYIQIDFVATVKSANRVWVCQGEETKELARGSVRVKGNLPLERKKAFCKKAILKSHELYLDGLKGKKKLEGSMSMSQLENLLEMAEIVIT